MHVQCSSSALILPKLCYQDAAHEKSQKYKEGKFILEREKIMETRTNSVDCYRMFLDDTDDDI